MLLLCGMLALIHVTEVSLWCTRFFIDSYWLGTQVYHVPCDVMFPFSVVLRHGLLQLKITLTSRSSCFCPLSAGITGKCPAYIWSLKEVVLLLLVCLVYLLYLRLALN